MVDFDEELTAVSGLDAHLRAVFEHSVFHDGYKDCGVERILLSPPECSQKENDELRAVNSQLKSWSEKQRAFSPALNILLFIVAPGLIWLKLNIKLHCIFCWILMPIHLQSSHISPLKVRALIGKEWNPELGMGTYGWTHKKMTVLNPKSLWGSLTPEVACPPVSEETTCTLLENSVITLPGEDDLKVSIHSLQLSPRPILVTSRFTAKGESQNAPGRQVHTHYDPGINNLHPQKCARLCYCTCSELWGTCVRVDPKGVRPKGAEYNTK